MPDVSSGWGRLTWGQANWNEATTLTQGWGAEAWGSGGSWGDVGDEIVSITGLEISSTYNPSITITAEINTGWGGRVWGENNWGDLSSITLSIPGFEVSSTLNTSLDISGNALLELTGQEISSTLGTITNVISVVNEPDGFEITSNQGTALPVIDATQIVTGFEITSAIGVVDPKDQVFGLPTFTITSEQGTAVAPNEDVSVTGQSSYIRTRNCSSRYYNNY